MNYNYSRFSAARKRSEELLIQQQAIAAAAASEERDIQKFILLQQSSLDTQTIGGVTGPSIPSVTTVLWYAYQGPTGPVNFTGGTIQEAHCAYLYGGGPTGNLNGETVRSFESIVVGSTVYSFGDPSSTFGQGNYVGSAGNTVITINSSGVVTAITNFADLPACV